MQLTELCSMYARRKLIGAHPTTLAKFQMAIRSYGLYLGHDPSLDDLDDESILEWAWSITRAGRSIDTASMYHAKLLALWRYAAGRGLVKLAPDHEKLKTPFRAPIAWSREQLRRLFEACNSAPGFIGGLPAHEWWTTLHLSLWDCGERIGAVLKARWSHVDLDAGWLFVPAESRKGRGADRQFRLHANTVAALREFREPARDKVWPFPYSSHTLWNKYRALLESAGLPHDRRHLFHCLRRSVASHFAAVGGDACRLLGHSSQDVTNRHYLDSKIVLEQQPADLLFRP